MSYQQSEKKFCSCDTQQNVRGVCTECYFPIDIKRSNYIRIGTTLKVEKIIDTEFLLADEIRTLIINDCKCSNNQFESFKNLESVYITDSEMDNLDFLLSNANLTRLEIRNSNITTINPILSVKRLYLLTSELFDLSSMINLEQISIDECGTLKNLSFLKEMDKLYELSVSNCPIENLEFPRLDTLRSLNLTNVGLERDLDLSILQNLTILELREPYQNISISQLPKYIHSLYIDGWLESVDFLNDMNRLTYINTGIVDDIDFKPIFERKNGGKKIYNIGLKSLNRNIQLISFLRTIDTEGVSYEIDNEPSYEEFPDDEIEYGSD